MNLDSVTPAHFSDWLNSLPAGKEFNYSDGYSCVFACFLTHELDAPVTCAPKLMRYGARGERAMSQWERLPEWMLELENTIVQYLENREDAMNSTSDFVSVETLKPLFKYLNFSLK